MNATNGRYGVKRAALSEAGITVTWDDGHESEFHAIWLRHQCHCAHCGTPINAVRGLRLHHIPENIVVTSIALSSDRISLRWSNDAHRSVYTTRWLRDHCYSKAERALRKHRPYLWDRRIENDPPVGRLPDAEACPQARLRILEAVRDYGFCKITDAPTGAGESQRLVEIVGPQRQTHFGTYTLSKKKAVDNVGDITAALDPHSDETYRLSTIGITVFQVLRPSTKGGDSTLVDGFEAVRRLRERWPDDFDLLTRVPIVAQRVDRALNSGGPSRWYSSRMSVIRVDSDGNVSGVRLNERQIAPLDVDADLVMPCYRALRRMFEFLYDPELRVTFALKAGEGLLFDNQRVLHGRTAFAPEEPARAVLTSSVDLEEFHSSLRLLEESLGTNSLPRSLGQGMVI